MSFFTQGLMVLLWIILARWLTPAEIGAYVLPIFVVDFFSGVAIMGLDSAITRFYCSAQRIQRVLCSALPILIGSLAISLVVFFALAPFLSRIIQGVETTAAHQRLLLALIIVVNTLVNFILVHYTALKLATQYAQLNLLKISIWFVLAILLSKMGFGVWGVLAALMIACAVVVALFFILQRTQISFYKRSSTVTKELFAYGFPLMLYGVVGVVVVYFSRIVLGRYTDLTTLGIYSFFLTLTLQVNGLWGSINRAWTPEIFSRLEQNTERTLSLMTRLVVLFTLGYLVALAVFIGVGEWFMLKLVLKDIYFSQRSLLYVLLLGPLFTGIYTVIYPLLYFKNHTKRILLISLILSVVNLILTFVLVKFWGLSGAVQSFVLMSIISTLLYLMTFKRVVHIPSKIMVWTTFVALAVVVVITVL